MRSQSVISFLFQGQKIGKSDAFMGLGIGKKLNTLVPKNYPNSITESFLFFLATVSCSKNKKSDVSDVSKKHCHAGYILFFFCHGFVKRLCKIKVSCFCLIAQNGKPYSSLIIVDDNLDQLRLQS